VRVDDSDFSVAVYALTGQGLELACRVCADFARVDLYLPESLRGQSIPLSRAEVRWFRRLNEAVGIGFRQYGCHVFITAAGIAVRAIAPHLQGKDRDPAVLVLDQRGQFVISLLSGHIGGANALAVRISERIGAQPVITTATDVEGLPALDLLAAERGLAIADLRAVKAVSSALLAGKRIRLYDPGNHLGIFGSVWEPLFTAMDEPPIQRDNKLTPDKFCNGADAVVIVSTKTFPVVEESESRLLLLHPRVLCAGIGCRKGVAAQDILAAIDAAFAESGLAVASLACLASIEAKQDEPGLLEAARRLGLPVYFYSAERLAVYPVLRPSAKVREIFGIDGVCEPAALAGAGERGHEARLLREKRASRGVTVAIATRAC